MNVVCPFCDWKYTGQDNEAKKRVHNHLLDSHPDQDANNPILPHYQAIMRSPFINYVSPRLLIADEKEGTESLDFLSPNISTDIYDMKK